MCSAVLDRGCGFGGMGSCERSEAPTLVHRENVPGSSQLAMLTAGSADQADRCGHTKFPVTPGSGEPAVSQVYSHDRIIYTNTLLCTPSVSAGFFYSEVGAACLSHLFYYPTQKP